MESKLKQKLSNLHLGWFCLHDMSFMLRLSLKEHKHDITTHFFLLSSELILRPHSLSALIYLLSRVLIFGCVCGIPLRAEWFSPATVHRLERQVVPHFFSGKSPEHMPGKYMECRNHIIVKYMNNPEKRITVSDCQGLVDGISNEDLTRIVRFLDHWGIINFCAAAPSHEPWNGGSYLREDLNGEVHVPSAALKSIDSLIKFDKPKCRLKAADVYSSLSCHDNDFSDLDNRIRERLTENYCTSCSQPIPTSYYQSEKEVCDFYAPVNLYIFHAKS